MNSDMPNLESVNDMPRHVVWFSCGAASSVVSKLAVDKYGDDCEVIYCDTSKNEHPDNSRFLKDVERWIGKEIKILRNENYEDIYDVFDKTGYLVGPSGARCTTELKKWVRQNYAQMDDINIFGYTYDESIKIGQGGLTRVQWFEGNNPEIIVEWLLVENEITKSDCYRIIQENGIELPMMYKLGYRNNNCIGCVKGGQGYWNKIRIDFPDVFKRMMLQECKMRRTVNKRYVGENREKLYLFNLDPNAGRYESEPDISCGITCVGLT